MANKRRSRAPRPQSSETDFLLQFILDEVKATNGKIDRLQDKVVELHVETARNTDSLVVHMKRSDENEATTRAAMEAVALLKEEVKQVKNPLLLLWSWVTVLGKVIFKFVKP